MTCGTRRTWTGLWPAGPAGRVLITAADAAAVPGEHGVLVCAVPAFSMREALNYLSGRLTTDPDQRSGAIDLAGALGCEPAALAQAAAVIASSGIRLPRVPGLLRPAAGAARRQAASCRPRRGSPGRLSAESCRAAGTRRGDLAAAGAGRAAGRPRHPRHRAHRPGHLPVPGRGAARPPDPQRAWSALLALEQAGLVAVDTASTPPAVWVSPALQAAARAAAPPDLLDRAARAAADALMEAWPQHQPRSWLAAALRSCAASLRQAAGDALWAGGGCHRLLLTAGAEPGRRRAGRPGGRLVAGAGRRQRAAPRPGPPGHPGGRRPAGRRAAGRRAGRRRGALVRCG